MNVVANAIDFGQRDADRPALLLGAEETRPDLLLDAHLAKPLVHRDRRIPFFNIPSAIEHFRRFKQDKEQTSEVFHIFEALPWVDVADQACRFLASEQGRAIYVDEPFLPDVLDDHDALRRLPKGSLAHEYADYMEAEGLSAAGLVAEYETFRGDRVRLDDKVEWYVDRLRDTHDLLHILTGFGRDTLGEQCLLTFVCTQRPSPGHFALGFGGAVVMKREVRTAAPTWRAVTEAYRIGKKAKRIAEQPIREILALPADDVRARLNIAPARFYDECQRVWREEGVNPYGVLAKAG